MKRDTNKKTDKSRLTVRLTDENTCKRIEAEANNIHISKWVNRVLGEAFDAEGFTGKKSAKTS